MYADRRTSPTLYTHIKDDNSNAFCDAMSFGPCLIVMRYMTNIARSGTGDAIRGQSCTLGSEMTGSILLMIMSLVFEGCIVKH